MLKQQQQKLLFETMDDKLRIHTNKKMADNLPVRRCPKHDEKGNNTHDIACMEEVQLRKKLRLPTTMASAMVSPACSDDFDPGQDERTSPPHSPRQWWFSRDSNINCSTSDKFAQAQGDPSSASGMVLSEHLGRTSDVVESLTHDIKNWSLMRLSTETSKTKQKGIQNDPKRRKEQQRRCKDAQRQVRMARRRCLEEQRSLLQSPDASAMD